ncbi:PROTEIN KINASE SUPERFAMILY PROTEIN [Salix koriyanagi]|uniref:PROTEIN KINASE SUPERFAMILY PROTEIN n=1 Tax=Salix koriyanagi TaxID=2511006 RepID=A0A9Q0WC28_9ROSI|nr:PROTEIN KINASE SUPERFAMILY PROTEIN [Salix koriyanagi]
MPSRPVPPFLPPQPSPLPYHQRSSSLIPPLATSSTAAFSFLLLLLICFRKLTRKRTVPTDFSKPPYRFSYATLRHATNKFSPSLRLGQGGFGSVYHGTLPNEFNVAVKAWLKIDNSNQSNQNDQNQFNQDQCEVKVEESDKINGEVKLKKVELESNNGGEDYGSVVEETDSVTTGFDEFNLVVDQLPVCMTSPETLEAVSASPETVGVVVLLEGKLDVGSKEGGKELVNGEKNSGGGIQIESRKDWWLKQENGDWIEASSSSNSQSAGKIVKKKKNRKRLDWWVSLDDDKDEKVLKKEKRRPAREWWKEEYCEELEKKNKKKKKKKREMEMTSDDNNGGEDWWPRDESLYGERKKKRSKSRGSRGSIEWFSGELFRGNRNSHDSLSGEIPYSGGISSTPSMRGTVCYAAPEYGGGGNLSEKSDVYSFGVFLLVLIAGRRPLQVTTTPMAEFQRANLMHWARNLARSGKLLDLVDRSVQSLDREQATLCITIALLCLQKSPAQRPSMKEVVGMLTGESPVPQLPSEFLSLHLPHGSPSSPGHTRRFVVAGKADAARIRSRLKDAVAEIPDCCIHGAAISLTGTCTG